MFDLSFLSNDDKRALERLQEKMNKEKTPKARNEIALLIQEISAKAKPYTQCDLIEADELRSQLLNKINILSRIGKTSEAFQTHLRDVDFHIQTLQLKETTKEQERPDEPKHGTENIRLSKLVKDKKRKEAFGQHRWSIGFEDDIVDVPKKKAK